ncbi:nitronate monooxygenase [Pseudoalteromonas sp. Cnat2-41]|uniref:NAD(P)H-dependent flavin oxidoreductase n=1 Tax=unclassified Pseudoalteromonas TaxID=194690 RepID=UPI001EF82209|nr:MULTISPECIES: nitronate monooxygenase [unclassified Pseudoalteromonas]MCF2860762.1 nitronate monooxygenase [Pseudoalteromonas sp. CNAT2-18]MCG7556631.1 nitronate monooxygenase [Pseudoalteromonas sp. CNAT2-18.1]
MDLLSTLNIAYPIIQAPMAGVQDEKLAIAVAHGGGLGSLPCAMLSEEQIMAQVSEFRQHTQRAPINLNFFCHSMPSLNQAEQSRWQQLLAPYYQALECHPNDDLGVLRQPFSAQHVTVLEQLRPEVVSFHFGLPEEKQLQRVKATGAVVLSSANTLAEARWLAQHGCDVIIAQGIEAGGHRAMFSSTLAEQGTTAQLCQQILAAKDINVPVIAAGGITQAEHVAHYLSMGVIAVQVGTSYLLCDEATTSAVHRQALRAEHRQTAITNLYSGRPARGITTSFMQEQGFISDQVPAFPYASAKLAPLRAKAQTLGKDDFTPLWSGTDRSGCHAISATELTRDLAAQLK